MPFDVYFPIAEVSARLGVSRRTVTRWAERGELGPVWRLERELTVGQAGLLAFLERNQADFSSAAKEMRRMAFDRRIGRVVPADRGALSPGVPARCEGELRRKMAGMEVGHE